MDATILRKLDTFFTKFRHKHYKKGEILVRGDDSPTGVFYLREGFVKEYAISKKGEELIVNIFKPTVFFPMSWAINNTPNEYFYEATTDLDIWQAPRDEVVAFIKDNPDVLFDLMSRTYKGTDGMLTRMTYLMSGNAYARLIAEIIIYAKRFGKKEKGKIEINISEKDIAALSGMTRETVSREIKLLKDKGLVSFHSNTLTIHDLPLLEKELGGGV